MAEPRAEVLRRIQETDRTEIHTWKPAIVRSYDADTQTAEVVIGVQEILPSGDEDTPDEAQDFPILTVPVIQFRAGRFFIHFPVENGTTGIVLFSDTDINAWRAGDGAPADPGIATRHGLSGGVFVPGLHVRSRPLVSADASGFKLGREESDCQIEIDASEIRVGGSDALAEAADVKAHLQAIDTALTAIAGALSPPSTSSYEYAVQILANPIETTRTKGT